MRGSQKSKLVISHNTNPFQKMSALSRVTIIFRVSSIFGLILIHQDLVEAIFGPVCMSM